MESKSGPKQKDRPETLAVGSEMIRRAGNLDPALALHASISSPCSLHVELRRGLGQVVQTVPCVHSKGIGGNNFLIHLIRTFQGGYILRLPDLV